LDKLIVATHNQGKLREIKRFFSDIPIEIISAAELSESSPKETGITYRENALSKARYLYNKYRIPTLADDSGLEVKALNGMPGIYSARFDGAKATYHSNNIKLLGLLEGKRDRRAEFVCVMILIADDKIYQATGKVAGNIAHDFSGTEGFGYDPLFIPVGYGRSYAEMEYKKQSISHRAVALKKIKRIIKTL